MIGSASEPTAEAVRVAELRRGATLGTLWLEIETMQLRLEIEGLWREVALERDDDVVADEARDDKAWIVSIDAARRKNRRAAEKTDEPTARRRRIFRLTTGRAALRPRAHRGDTRAMLAVARELVSVLESELNKSRIVAA